MNVNKLWKTFLLSLGAVSLIVSLASGDEIEEILKYSFDAQSRVNLEGIREETIYTAKHTYTITVKVVYQKPNFVYITCMDPPQLKGRVLIDDGEKRIEYLPDINRIKVLPSLTGSQIEERRKKMLGVLLENFVISEVSEEQMLGRSVYVLSLSPRNQANPSLKLWLDKETYLPLRKEKAIEHSYNRQLTI